MSKLTTGAAVVFMITCLMLSYMYRPGAGRGRSVMTDIQTEQAEPQPPAPQQPAVPEARPVQPEAPAPEASGKAAETPHQAPADVSKQQASPTTDTGVKPPPAKTQPQQGQKKQDKTPAKKQ